MNAMVTNSFIFLNRFTGLLSISFSSVGARKRVFRGLKAASRKKKEDTIGLYAGDRGCYTWLLIFFLSRLIYRLFCDKTFSFHRSSCAHP